VCSIDDVKTPSNPANANNFFATDPATILDPRGAEISLILTEPHRPVPVLGTVSGGPILFPQYPRQTERIANFANLAVVFHIKSNMIVIITEFVFGPGWSSQNILWVWFQEGDQQYQVLWF
jgi:hypothetical protein